MNKKFVKLFIFVLLVSFSKEALAGTDVLCNVLTTINTTLKEVGEVFNLTKERIRQIEKKAIKRLQHPTRASRLEAFIA
jgi:hypothetical protein